VYVTIGGSPSGERFTKSSGPVDGTFNATGRTVEQIVAGPGRIRFRAWSGDVWRVGLTNANTPAALQATGAMPFALWCDGTVNVEVREAGVYKSGIVQPAASWNDWEIQVDAAGQVTYERIGGSSYASLTDPASLPLAMGIAFDGALNGYIEDIDITGTGAGTYDLITTRAVRRKPALPNPFPTLGGSALDGHFGTRFFRMTDETTFGAGVSALLASASMQSWIDSSDTLMMVRARTGAQALIEMALGAGTLTRSHYHTFGNEWGGAGEPAFSRCLDKPRIMRGWGGTGYKIRELDCDTLVFTDHTDIPTFFDVTLNPTDPGRQYPYVFYSSDIDGLSGKEMGVCLFGGTSAASHKYVGIWNLRNPADTKWLIDTVASTIRVNNGVATALLDETGAPIVMGVPLHSLSMDLEGQYIEMGPMYVSNHFYQFKFSSGRVTYVDEYPSGHKSYGRRGGGTAGVAINMEPITTAYPQWLRRFFDDPHNPVELIAATPDDTYGTSDHSCFNDSDFTIARPVAVSIFREIDPTRLDDAWAIYDDEHVKVATDLSGTVFEVGHTRIDLRAAPGQDPTIETFTQQPSLQVSRDGMWLFANSNMEGTLGEDTGPGDDHVTRCDIFAWYCAQEQVMVPAVATTPGPANGATGVGPVAPVLTWAVPQSTTQYKVHFGTTATPPLVATLDSLPNGVWGLPTPLYVPGVLLPNTTYYWRINSADPVLGETTGALWSFTTGPIPGTAIFIDEVNETDHVRGNPDPGKRREIRIDMALGGDWTAEFDSFDPTDSTATAFRTALKDAIWIETNGVRRFTGKATKVGDDPWGSSASGVVTPVTAKGFTALDDIQVVEAHYPAGLNLKTVLTNLRGQGGTGLWFYGYTIDAGMLNGPTLPEITFTKTSHRQAWNRLSELTGWVIRATPGFVIQAFAPGTSPGIAPYDITAANGQAVLLGGGKKVLTWEQTLGDYYNKVNLRYGQNITVPKLQTFPAATAGQTAWRLNHPGAGVNLNGYILVNGTHTLISVYGDAESLPYKWDAATQSIIRSPGATGGEVVVVPYNAQFPDVVTAEDAAEILANDLKEVTIDAPDIYDRDEALAQVAALLRIGIEQPKQVTVATRSSTDWFTPGDMIELDFPDRLVEGDHLITHVSAVNVLEETWEFTLTCLSGSEQKRSWTERLRGILAGSGGGASTGGGTVIGTMLPASSGHFAENVFAGTEAIGQVVEIGLITETTVTDGGGGPGIRGGFGTKRFGFYYSDESVDQWLKWSLGAYTPLGIRLTGSDYHLQPGPNTNVTRGMYLGGNRDARDRWDALYLNDGGIFEGGAAIARGFWQAWVPTLTNLTIGNGTIVAGYTVVLGKTVRFFFRILFGSTTAVTGAPGFSLPINLAPYRSNAGDLVGDATYRIAAGSIYRGVALAVSASTVELRDNGNPMALLSATVPFTHATGTSWVIEGEYEGV
jgi:hypothetical protein